MTVFVRSLDIYGSPVSIEDYQGNTKSTSKSGGILTIISVLITAILVCFKASNIYQEISLEQALIDEN